MHSCVRRCLFVSPAGRTNLGRVGPDPLGRVRAQMAHGAGHALLACCRSSLCRAAPADVSRRRVRCPRRRLGRCAAAKQRRIYAACISTSATVQRVGFVQRLCAACMVALQSYSQGWRCGTGVLSSLSWTTSKDEQGAGAGRESRVAPSGRSVPGLTASWRCPVWVKCCLTLGVLFVLSAGPLSCSEKASSPVRI